MSHTITIKVLLNMTNRFESYRVNDHLHEALRFDTMVPGCANPARILMIVWEQLNRDMPQASWAIEYRWKGHRSLSVGDVVVVGEQAWAAESEGWKRVTVQAMQVWFDVGKVAE